WIQVETAHATAALRTIDAGSNLPVVYRTIPRRVPEFVGTPLKAGFPRMCEKCGASRCPVDGSGCRDISPASAGGWLVFLSLHPGCV
ncbi:MAG: hypothetical protein WCF19_00795, partial [Chlamydiales bacterium]